MNLFFRRLIVVIASLFIGVTSVSACTQSPQRVVLEKLLNIEMDHAESLINQWQKGLKKEYYKGMLYLVRAYNSGAGVDEGLKTQAAKQLGRVIKKAEFELPDSSDPETALILALSRMYRAGISMTQGKKSSAYNDTFSSREILTELQADYPDMEGIYHPLGMYEFFLSQIPKKMKTKAKLLSLTGNKELGIQYLERTVENSANSAPEAARVLLVEANLSEAEMCRYQSLSRDMEKRYPKNELLQLTRSIIQLQCNIANQEGKAVAADAPFMINDGCSGSF